MKHPLIVPMLLIALVLAGCGDTTSTAGGADDGQADATGVDDEAAADGEVAAESEAPADEAAAEDEAPVDDDGVDPDDDEAAPAASAASEPLTGADGWAELHDVPLPEPGRMELTVDGQVFASDVRCGQDPVRDDEASGSMFLFSLLESGVTDDGRDFRIMVNRAIAVDGQIDQMYDTAGSSAQVTLVIGGEQGNSSSVALSPNDDDPQGALLPLVHVDPSGGFTMEATMEVFEGDDAVAGDAALAGRCQDGWPG